MNRYSLLVLCILISSTLFSQNLQIQKGSKTRSINNNQFIELIIETPGSNETGDCGYSTVSGYLQAFSKDSLSINTKELIVCGEINGVDIRKSLSVSGTSITKLAFDDLLEMHVYKSQKARDHKETLLGFGALFVCTGIATGLHVLAVDGKSNKQALGFSGAAQVGAGLLLFSLGAKKKYTVKSPYGDSDIWRVVH